jgi:hypothetical protein
MIKTNESQDPGCSIKQIPENLERLTNSTTTEPKEISTRKPPLGSIQSRREHTCSPPPPFANHNRQMSNDANSSMEVSVDSNNNSIKTSSPEAVTLSQEDVSSPILSQTIEGPSIDDNFLSSTAKDEILTEKSLTKRHIYSIQALRALKSSPAVLKHPPQLGSNLLCKKMNEQTHKSLFDKNYNNSYDDSHDMSHSNSSFKFGNVSKKSYNDYRSNDNHMSRNNSKTQEKNGLIRISLSQPEIILNEAKDAWMPTHLKPVVRLDDNEEKLERLNKNFRSLLNKITAENFDHLSEDARNPHQYPINNMESLQTVSKLFFNSTVI